MAAKASKKKATKKSRRKKDVGDDPPIIVGSGGSVPRGGDGGQIIYIRKDLNPIELPPKGGYRRWLLAGVSIQTVDVDGKNQKVPPTNNKVVFTE